MPPAVVAAHPPVQDLYEQVSPRPRANRAAAIAVGVAVVAGAVVAVSLVTLGGGTSPAAQPPGPTEIIHPTNPGTSATLVSGTAASSTGTSATAADPGNSAAPQPGPIAGVSSKRCVGTTNANPADGTQLRLVDCNGTPAQSWTYTGGTVHIMDKCLDVRGANSHDGTPVQVFACNGSAAQQWSYNPQTGELKTLGKCLDASGESTADRTPLILYTCHNGSNQKWHMTT